MLFAFIFSLFFGGSELPPNVVFTDNRFVWEEKNFSQKQCKDFLLVEVKQSSESHVIEQSLLPPLVTPLVAKEKSQTEEQNREKENKEEKQETNNGEENTSAPALITKPNTKTNSDKYLVLSRCKNSGWQWFQAQDDTRTDKKNYTQEFIDDFYQQYRIFAVAQNSLTVEDVKNQKLFLLNKDKWYPLELYNASADILFFSLNNKWYVVYSNEQQNSLQPRQAKHNNFSQLPNFFSQISQAAYWTFMDHVFLVEEEQLFFIRFKKQWSKELAIYDLQKNEWQLAPPSVLTPAIWQSIRSNVYNVLFQLDGNVHAQEKKMYYDIKIDGELVEKSKTLLNSQQFAFGQYLPPGRHLLQIIRYVADEEGERYVQDNNINQLDPLAVFVEEQTVNYIYIRKGLPNEDKPFYLDVIYLPSK